jgi:hypothetical protein
MRSNHLCTGMTVPGLVPGIVAGIQVFLAGLRREKRGWRPDQAGRDKPGMTPEKCSNDPNGLQRANAEI